MIDPLSSIRAGEVSRPTVRKNCADDLDSSLIDIRIVSVSSVPKFASLAAELALQDIPIDYAKIAQIKQAISRGEYLLDPEKTALAMMRFGRKSI